MFTVTFRGNTVSGIEKVTKKGDTVVLSGGVTSVKFSGVEELQVVARGLFEDVRARRLVTTTDCFCRNKYVDFDCLTVVLNDNDVDEFESGDSTENGNIVLSNVTSDRIISNTDAEVLEILQTTYSDNDNLCLPDDDVFIIGEVMRSCSARNLVCNSTMSTVEKYFKGYETKLDIKYIKRSYLLNNVKGYTPFGRGFEHIVDKATDKVNTDGTIPFYATRSSAAADFRSDKDVVIPPVEVEDGKLVAKPTLVHTGIKAYMPPNEALHLYNRSSNPKRGLVLANGVGVVDADYYNNESNDGDIMFAFFNFSGEPYVIKKGDVIGQGEFCKYQRPANASVNDVERSGGFGSTSK